MVISLRDKIKKKKKEKNRFYISCRLLLAVVLLLCAMIPLVLNTHLRLKSFLDDSLKGRMNEVQAHSLILANEIATSGYLDGQPNQALVSEITQLSNLYDGRVLVINRNFKIIKDTYALDEGKTNISEEVLRCFQGESLYSYVEEECYMEFARPIYNTTNTEVVGCLIVGTSTETLVSAHEKMVSENIGRMVLTLILMIPLSIFVSTVMSRPFLKLADELKKTASGDLEATIMVDGYLETRQISDAHNQLLARLRQLDESRQQFVSNVSHELKTPITSIRVLADSLLAMGEAPAELYREFLNDISEEIDRESQIIEDLLSLVKLDKANQELNISQTNLNLLLEGLLKRLRPLAMKKQVELILESYRPVMAEVDEMKLSLALSNMIENAIKYNIEGGWVRVTLNADHRYFYVKVSDTGVGIPMEAQNHVFERFYRADKSRSRETGGTGLGLAITQSIVFLHRGAIKLYSEEGEGTTFTVRIPLTYIP